ncbi:hypothetical protein CsSME_00018135 [Camellia sinensis var. sinensis]
MYAIWVSLKENLSCRSKLTDAICRPEKIGKHRKFIFKKENSESELVHPMEERVCELVFRQNHPPNWYYELNTGDPSRNIIEMIIRAASTYPSQHCKKIKRVLRVNNSANTVERFEKYRETVKNRTREGQHKQNLRTTVDGNELLQFYGTTMNCCSRKPSKKVSDTCKDPTCRVCRVIQSGFNTAYTRKNGIRLSTSSEEVSEDAIGFAEGKKNLKRAVVVCRTIAGTVANAIDDEKSWEEHDSVRIGRLYSEAEYLIVQNPSAVLPCFVVVFN